MGTAKDPTFVSAIRPHAFRVLLAAGEAASRVPVPQCLLRRIAKTGCVVFLSHAVVAESAPPHLEWLFPCKTSARYEDDLRWLQRHYQFVSYEDIDAAEIGARPLPRNAALLTFDDGYAELHSIVWPILRRLGIPALAFLTTAQIDNAALSADCRASLSVSRLLQLKDVDQRSIVKSLNLPNVADIRSRDAGFALFSYLRSHDEIGRTTWCRLALDEASYLRAAAPYLTSEQVGEMAAGGWSFGGHATVHRQLQGLSQDELEREVVESCAIAAGLAGRCRAPFAFPHLGKGVRRDWLADIRARNSGVGLFFDVFGLRTEDSLVWHRVNIENPSESIGTSVRRAYLMALAGR